MKNDKWYFVRASQSIGPVSLGELKNRVSSGELTHLSLVRSSFMSEWESAGRVANLYGTKVALNTPPPLPVERTGQFLESSPVIKERTSTPVKRHKRRWVTYLAIATVSTAIAFILFLAFKPPFQSVELSATDKQSEIQPETPDKSDETDRQPGKPKEANLPETVVQPIELPAPDTKSEILPESQTKLNETDLKSGKPKEANPPKAVTRKINKPPPPSAAAPFDAAKARGHQRSWADHLGISIEITNSIGMKMTLVPPGEFMMGSKELKDNALPLHKVTLTQPFQLGVYEVTQEQYAKLVGNNPSEFKGSTNPVERVSWADAISFCSLLSNLPEEKAAGRTYRLPTEAEWEYACRAGRKSDYCFGNDRSELGDYAWWEANSDAHSHSVGGRQPNAWGFYDMHGNVYEFCADWYGDYPDGNASDPTGPALGTKRVLRGGGWHSGLTNCRLSFRAKMPPQAMVNTCGFRVVCVFPGGRGAGDNGSDDLDPSERTSISADAQAPSTKAIKNSNPNLVDRERLAAKTILELGGTVNIHGGSKPLQTIADIPEHQFVVRRIEIRKPALKAFKRGQISNTDMKNLENLKGLEMVTLAGVGITDEGVRSLCTNRRLKYLWVFDNRITNKSLSHIAKLPDLQNLNINNTKITDLMSLSPLKNLRRLYLAALKIDDSDLRVLLEFPKLDLLHLHGTPITEKSISTLTQLRNLAELGIPGTRITPRGKASLSKNLPGCKIKK